MANHFDRHYCGKCGLTYVYQKAQGLFQGLRGAAAAAVTVLGGYSANMASWVEHATWRRWLRPSRATSSMRNPGRRIHQRR
ncbi:hypothetical protein BHM03_00001014 [Ensete ventricosum]|nr:hypothetical protein BHM03_00001014 [Ensete ventricosum]